jgi:hypothetical protein
MSAATRTAVTGWRLADGAVVYLTAEGTWARDIAEARFAGDSQDAEAMMTLAEDAVQRREVVGPYLFDLALEDGAPRPRRLREIIRATGPTVGHVAGAAREG